MGYCSRSDASALVRAGRVMLNGRVVRDPETPARVGLDRIAVDSSSVEAQGKIYLAMNKPRGVVTTASDEKGRATVYDLLPLSGAWVGPVGRLDKASEGLLLFTNDSEWAARITDPARHLDKCYHVQVDRVASADLISQLLGGIRAGGERLSAKAARILRAGEKNSWLEITLDEGKNRQIRRLLNAVSVEVLRLVRVSVGPVALGNLKKGATRPLTEGEKLSLDRALIAPGKNASKKTTGACR
jgi:23S rRNA pseudouridine2605 synthase